MIGSNLGSLCLGAFLALFTRDIGTLERAKDKSSGLKMLVVFSNCFNGDDVAHTYLVRHLLVLAHEVRLVNFILSSCSRSGGVARGSHEVRTPNSGSASLSMNVSSSRQF